MHCMSIWFKHYKIEDFRISTNIDKHLGIEFIELGADYLKARMPVNDKTRQPLGLCMVVLHVLLQKAQPVVLLF